MNTHEVYVSDETLELLKKADFDWKCRKIQISLAVFSSRPTLSEAQKWLREVHNMHIEISHSNSKINPAFICVVMYFGRNGVPIKHFVYHKINFNGYEMQVNEYDTFELAQEAGIKFLCHEIIDAA